MYSPRIKETLISRLYLLCRDLKIPMTAFVNGATERALILAEACLARGQKNDVFELIGVEVPRSASVDKE